MTTALTIIKGALLEAGVIDPLETPGADQVAVCLDKLNDLIDTWGTQPQAAINNTETVVTLPGSTRSLTIGPGQTINVARPIRIESAYARLQNIDRPIDVVEKQSYDEISVKGLGTSWPEMLWYDGGYPTGNVYFWPLASAPVELHITTLNYVVEFADANTDQALTKGYRRALILGLAEELCGLFGVPMPPSLERRAAMALKAVKRANASVPELETTARRTSRLGAFLGGF